MHLTDDRALLPAGVRNVAEFRVAPERLEWTLLRVRMEELRGTRVSICVGDCQHTADNSLIGSENQDTQPLATRAMPGREP